jgi:ABC-2 type transport system permease protein
MWGSGPLSNLPTVFGIIVSLDPLAYGVDGLRAALIGVPHFGPVIDALVLIVVVGILLVIGSRLFSRVQV